MKGASRLSKTKTTKQRASRQSSAVSRVTPSSSLSSMATTSTSSPSRSIASKSSVSLGRTVSAASTIRSASASTIKRRSLSTFSTAESVEVPVVAAPVVSRVASTRSDAVVAPVATRRPQRMAAPVSAASFSVSTKASFSPSIRTFSTATAPRVVSSSAVKLTTSKAAASFAVAAGLRKFSTERKAGYINLNFTTPAGAVIPQGPVHMFEVSTIEGDMGVIADHSPFIGELRPGVVKVFTEPGADAKKWFVPGGFMLIKNDSQADLTASEAIPVDELDAEVARKTLEQANAQLAAATDDLSKAEATITIDVCNAVIKAAESV